MLSVFLPNSSQIEDIPDQNLLFKKNYFNRPISISRPRLQNLALICLKINNQLKEWFDWEEWGKIFQLIQFESLKIKYRK